MYTERKKLYKPPCFISLMITSAQTWYFRDLFKVHTFLIIPHNYKSGYILSLKSCAVSKGSSYSYQIRINVDKGWKYVHIYETWPCLMKKQYQIGKKIKEETVRSIIKKPGWKRRNPLCMQRHKSAKRGSHAYVMSAKLEKGTSKLLNTVIFLLREQKENIGIRIYLYKLSTRVDSDSLHRDRTGQSESK